MYLEDLTKEYIKEINKDKEQADYIVSKVGRFDQELVDDIYDSALLRMCIKYESWTADAYQKIVSHENVKYNHPWAYTRMFAHNLDIDIYREYEYAHDLWEIYNALKHVNYKTRLIANKMSEKYNLKTAQDRMNAMRDALTELLSRFLI